MFSWIGDHFLELLLLVAAIVVARKGFAWLTRHGGPKGSRSLSTAFCNKCGWMGKLGKTKKSCGRCGSPKLTLRTS